MSKNDERKTLRVPNCRPFTEAAMGRQEGSPTRPYSREFFYANELGAFCEIQRAIDLNKTVEEFVVQHRINFNFSRRLDNLLKQRPQHELAHLLLGMAFLKMGRNPFPFDHSYDGNAYAETFVFALENCFHRLTYHMHQNSDCVPHVFVKNVFDHFPDGEKTCLNKQADLAAAEKFEFPRSVWEFRKIEESFEREKRDFPGVAVNKWGESANIEDFYSLTKYDVLEIFMTIRPALVAINDAVAERCMYESSRDRDFVSLELLRQLYVPGLWSAIDNDDPKIKLQHRMFACCPSNGMAPPQMYVFPQ